MVPKWFPKWFPSGSRFWGGSHWFPRIDGNHLKWVWFGLLSASDRLGDEGLSSEGDALFLGQFDRLIHPKVEGVAELVKASGEVNGLDGEASVAGGFVSDGDDVVEVFDDEVYLLGTPADA